MSTLNDNIETQQKLSYLVESREKLTIQKYIFLEKLEHLSYKAIQKKKEQKDSGKIYDLELEDIKSEIIANQKYLDETENEINKIRANIYSDHLADGVRKLITNLLVCGFNNKETKNAISVYDPWCYNLTNLLETENLLKKQQKDTEINLFGHASPAHHDSSLLELDKKTNLRIEKDYTSKNYFSGKKFDLLISTPAFGIRMKSFNVSHLEYEGKRFGNSDVVVLQDLLFKSKKNSRIACLLAPINIDGASFLKNSKLLEKDLIESIIRLPSSSLKDTSLQPYIIIISKNKIVKNKIFLINTIDFFEKNSGGLSIDHKSINTIVNIYKNYKETKNTLLVRKKDINKRIFFDSYFQLRETIDMQKKAGITKTTLKKFIVKDNEIEEINSIQKIVAGDLFQLEEKNYTDYVFFNSIPSKKRILEIDPKKLNPKSPYFAVKIKRKYLSPKFLYLFYNTDLGKEILLAKASGTTIRHLPKDAILDLPIPDRNINDQESIIEKFTKVDSLAQSIDDIKIKILSNPLIPINKIFVDLIADSDHEIEQLISSHEGQDIELKSTFSKPLEGGSQNDVETSALKAMVGFLNSQDGGILLIGIKDDKEVIGIMEDKFRSTEKFQNHLRQRIEKRIGGKLISNGYIKIRLIEYKNKHVCHIQCFPINGEVVFLDNQEVWVREVASTILKEGRDLADFLEHKLKS